MRAVQNIAELIGETPLVKLNRVQPENAAQVYIKLESFNPSGSVKDRAAYQMILMPKKRLVETGFNHHRTDEREHRHRPCDERGGKGLQSHSCHA